MHCVKNESKSTWHEHNFINIFVDIYIYQKIPFKIISNTTQTFPLHISYVKVFLKSISNTNARGAVDYKCLIFV